MEIDETQLKQLASHIILNLKCVCGFSYNQSKNEPCACS